MTKRIWLYLLGAALVVLVILQMVPSSPAENPAVEEEVTAPVAVVEILEQSCYDCHSFETEWPWYAHVAPPKWFVRDHVADAREDLNFSAWNRYDAEERAHKWEEVAEEVDEGHMPLRSYLFIHRDARLSEVDRQVLVDWARGQAGAEADEGAGAEGESAVETD